MATYNRAHLIKKSLDYILNQSFEDWECIVVDDGSTDKTSELIQSYLQDCRFRYLKRSNNYKKGLPGCRNFGLDVSKGEYIIFFDDDDIPHPQNLEICIRELKISGLDFCHYNKKSFAVSAPIFEKKKLPEEHSRIGIENIDQVISNQIPLASCTVMWKKACFKNIRFNESLQYAEEWECYIRILLNGFSGIGIESTLYFNRKHPNSNTGEFWSGNQKRRNSKIKAVKLVINCLVKEKLLSKTLIRYFVQMGIFLKDISIIKYLFKIANISLFFKWKYYLLYYFYPIIGRLYRVKKRLTNG